MHNNMSRTGTCIQVYYNVCKMIWMLVHELVFTKRGFELNSD